jgi:hypothetical protein
MLIPSVESLRDTFRRTVKQVLKSCEETHPGHFASRSRSLAGSPWLEIGPRVQAVQVAEAEFLIRGSWQYTIDPRAKDQFQVAQSQISDFAALLVSAIPQGVPVKGTFDFPPYETTPEGTKVSCSFRGVVCGQVLCAVLA